MNEQEKLAYARQRVDSMFGFYIHAAIYVAVIAILAAVNLFSGSQWWVQWPLLGWGAGLAAHALIVFGRTPRFIQQWQVRKIKEIKDSL